MQDEYRTITSNKIQLENKFTLKKVQLTDSLKTQIQEFQTEFQESLLKDKQEVINLKAKVISQQKLLDSKNSIILEQEILISQLKLRLESFENSKRNENTQSIDQEILMQLQLELDEQLALNQKLRAKANRLCGYLVCLRLYNAELGMKIQQDQYDPNLLFMPKLPDHSNLINSLQESERHKKDQIEQLVQQFYNQGNQNYKILKKKTYNLKRKIKIQKEGFRSLMLHKILMQENNKIQSNNSKNNQLINNYQSKIIFIKSNNLNLKINVNSQMILFLKRENLKIYNQYSIQNQLEENIQLMFLEIPVYILQLSLEFIQKHNNIKNIDLKKNKQMRSNSLKLNQAQEQIMIQDLQRVVKLNEMQGREILTYCSWNLQKASNFVLDIQNKGVRVEEQFNKYASKQTGLIEADGITAFCAELGIDIMDPIILYISYIFKSDTMGVYTKFDFLFGFQTLKCQSTIELRKMLPNLRNELNKKETLKQVYKFCFDFTKQKNRKDIDLQIASGLWETLLKKNYPIMNSFLEFVNQIPEQDQRPISRDTYYMLWEFCEQFGNDLSKYDYKTGAWPTFLDTFYFYMFPAHKQ